MAPSKDSVLVETDERTHLEACRNDALAVSGCRSEPVRIPRLGIAGSSAEPYRTG